MKFMSIIAFASLAMALAGCATEPSSSESTTAETTTQVTQFHMLNAHDGWAWSGGLAGQQRLLRTTDGGATWRDVTPRGISHVEEGASFYDAHRAWVSFFNRTNITAGLLHTTDGGESWQFLNQTNTPLFNEASSLRFFSPGYGVGNAGDSGLGSSYTTFYETHDAGKSWNPIPFVPRFVFGNEPSNTFHLSNIAGDRIVFYPPGSAIITYGDMADETTKGVLRLSITRNLGKNWRDFKLPLAAHYQNSLCVPLEPVFVDKQNIVLAAHVFESTSNSYSTGTLIFYTSRDGGRTWMDRQGTLDLEQPWYGDGFHAVSPKCFFVASGSNISFTHDGAQSWKTITPNILFGGNSKRDIVHVDFVDANHGWLVISDHNQFHPGGKFILYRTADGGKTWAELPVRIVN